jgi:hypothetical protein
MNNALESKASSLSSNQFLIAQDIPNPIGWLIDEVSKNIVAAFLAVLIAIGTGIYNLVTTKKLVDALSPNTVAQVLDSTKRINRYAELTTEAEVKGDVVGARVLRRLMSEEYISVANALERDLPFIGQRNAKMTEPAEKLIKQANAMSQAILQPNSPLPTFNPQDIQANIQNEDKPPMSLAQENSKDDRTVNNVNREEVVTILNKSGAMKKLGLDSNSVIDQDIALQLFAKSKNSDRDFTTESPNTEFLSHEESKKYRDFIDGKAQDTLSRQSPPEIANTKESSYVMG